MGASLLALRKSIGWQIKTVQKTILDKSDRLCGY